MMLLLAIMIKKKEIRIIDLQSIFHARTDKAEEEVSFLDHVLHLVPKATRKTGGMEWRERGLSSPLSIFVGLSSV